MGPDLVAHGGEARADLRPGQGRGLGLEADIVEPAQTRQVALPGFGQVVERVGGAAAPAPLVLLTHVLRVGVREEDHVHAVADRAEPVGLGHQAHPVQGAVQGVLGHRRALGLRLQQEVDDVGAEPGIGLTIAHAPEAEGAVERLAVEQLGDRRGQRGRGAPELRRTAHLGCVKQGEGGRHQLLAAAVGVARQGRRDRRRVEAAERRIGHGQADATCGEAGKDARRRGVALARLLQFAGRPRGRPPSQSRLQGIAALVGEARAGGLERHRPNQRPVGRGRVEVLGDALAGAEGDAVRLPRPVAASADLGAISSGLAGHVVELQRRLGVVAGGEEARQAEFGNHRLAHGHVRGPGADGLVGPGDGHQPELAVEVAGGQADGRLAVGVGVDHAGPQGDGLGRHHREASAAELVAAEADRPRRAEVGVEQAAIVVAIAQPQGPLAEVPGDRVGILLVGQAQHALIDRRQGHVRLLARTQALDREGHDHRGLAVQHLRRVHGHRQLPARRLQRHIGDTQRPARLGTGHRVARLHHRDHDVGPRAPVGVGRELHRGPVLRHGDLFGGDQTVAGDGDLGLAGEGRLDAHLDLIAGAIAGAQGRDPRGVRRLDPVGGFAPAGRLADHGPGAAAHRVLQLQAVVAPAEAPRDALRR